MNLLMRDFQNGGGSRKSPLAANIWFFLARHSGHGTLEHGAVNNVRIGRSNNYNNGPILFPAVRFPYSVGYIVEHGGGSKEKKADCWKSWTQKVGW